MNIADKCPCLGCMERTVGCHTGITVMTRLQGYKNSKGNIKSKGVYYYEMHEAYG